MVYCSRMANFEGENSIGVESGQDGVSGLNKYISGKFDPSLTWDDVKWLVNFTKLPVIVKGVLRADDAIKAVECGCKGVFVSNHGARQIDGVPASVFINGSNLTKYLILNSFFLIYIKLGIFIICIFLIFLCILKLNQIHFVLSVWQLL